ncbi:hypothetical protein [Phyllobacterium myrsinacearum]|uniref:Uncharacterized protein n=1 Tax=Phyllobacterium myrsinacearum TaxID=28101 RepID=A0A839EZG9_9HYPH|nr:hypothetical protein [Phyllobacterium myrsinacearum]MBA8881850.1 hypothetical protein [Phyllobacterium myrsinacearum]
MRNVARSLGISLVLLSITGQASEAADCHALVRQSITDDMSNVWQKGQKLPLDIARKGPDGWLYCTHGGSCIPRDMNGTEAVHLIDCKVGVAIGEGDYRLEQTSKGHKKS